jgi:hypothetical protein
MRYEGRGVKDEGRMTKAETPAFVIRRWSFVLLRRLRFIVAIGENSVPMCEEGR